MKQKPRPYRGHKLGTEEWVEGWYFYRWRTEQHAIHLPESAGVMVDREYEVDPTTLGQSTGETDRNGVILYEDDVCTDMRAERWLIIYKKAAFWLENMSTKQRWLLDAARVEKVGTAFDKAEVLYRGAPTRSTAGSDDDE